MKGGQGDGDVRMGWRGRRAGNVAAAVVVVVWKDAVLDLW